mmetsp:Transcript_58183/g.161157  ORF Transcript_58183/g.161157 Transcript_58183/m.161157 type:complete len:626 (+) Transcript_58183:355-2232(+)
MSHGLGGDRVSSVNELRELVEVEVSVDLGLVLRELVLVRKVLLRGRELAHDGRHRRKLGRREVHVGALAEAVGEVAGGGGDDGRLVSHARLVAHAERAARHLGACSHAAVDRVVALGGELRLVHLGWRGDPEAGRELAIEFVEELAGGAEVANVGHARANEDLIDRGARALGEEAGVVRVVRAADDRLLDVGEVNVEDLGVLGALVGLEELRRVDPRLHGVGAAREGAGIAVALRDHPAEHDDVRLEVLDDRLLIKLDGAASGRAFRRGVRELEGLLALEVAEALDLEDTAREDVLLALLLDGEVARLDGVVRDGVDEVTEGDARLHVTLEAHEHRLGHVQRHGAGGRRECDEARARRERDADRKAGVRVAAGANRVRQEHAVEPRVDDSVARAKRDAAAVADEVGERVMGDHIDRLGVGGGVAEGLHHEVGAEAEAGEVLELVARHGAGGVLRADRGHLRLTVHAREHALALRQAARAAHHLLREREALHRRGVGLGQAECVGRWKAERLAGAAGEATADDERDAPAGLDLVEEHVGLHLELRHELLSAVALHLALVREDVDGVVHVELRHITLERESTRVLHGVEEDGSDLAANADTAGALVRHVRNIIAHVPEDRVGGRLAR